MRCSFLKSEKKSILANSIKTCKNYGFKNSFFDKHLKQLKNRILKQANLRIRPIQKAC